MDVIWKAGRTVSVSEEWGIGGEYGEYLPHIIKCGR